MLSCNELNFIDHEYSPSGFSGDDFGDFARAFSPVFFVLFLTNQHTSETKQASNTRYLPSFYKHQQASRQ